MNQLLKDLKALKRLLRAKERWAKGGMAFRPDENGTPCAVLCNSINPEADCWCLLGGSRKVTYPKDIDELSVGDPSYIPIRDAADVRYQDLRRALVQVMPNRYRGAGDIPAYNDTPGRTHDQIVDLIEKAIEKEASK